MSSGADLNTRTIITTAVILLIASSQSRSRATDDLMMMICLEILAPNGHPRARWFVGAAGQEEEGAREGKGSCEPARVKSHKYQRALAMINLSL